MMLPKLDTKALRRTCEAFVIKGRSGYADFSAKWARHKEEADAYARLPENPLAKVHRERGERIKAEAVTGLPDHEAMSEAQVQLDLGEHELAIPPLMRKGHHLPQKEDSDLREIREMMVADRYDRDIAAMSVAEQARELSDLMATIDYNGPPPDVAAKLHAWTRAHARTSLRGEANSAYIRIFGGQGNGGEHEPGALELRWKARTEMLDDIAAARADLRAAEGYVRMTLNPGGETPVAVSMDRARQHGHLKAA